MKLVLICIILTTSLTTWAQTTFKNVGKFNCKDIATIFPYENPTFLFNLKLEAEVSTKEYDLTNADGMSKAQFRMAYAIKKSNENTILEQAIFNDESLATTNLPIPNYDFYTVSYKLTTRGNRSYRDIYVTIPTDFNRYRSFAMKIQIGELDNRNTEVFSVTCKNLNYPN